MNGWQMEMQRGKEKPAEGKSTDFAWLALAAEKGGGQVK